MQEGYNNNKVINEENKGNKNLIDDDSLSSVGKV